MKRSLARSPHPFLDRYKGSNSLVVRTGLSKRPATVELQCMRTTMEQQLWNHTASYASAHRILCKHTKPCWCTCDPNNCICGFVPKASMQPNKPAACARLGMLHGASSKPSAAVCCQTRRTHSSNVHHFEPKGMRLVHIVQGPILQERTICDEATSMPVWFRPNHPKQACACLPKPAPVLMNLLPGDVEQRPCSE